MHDVIITDFVKMASSQRNLRHSVTGTTATSTGKTIRSQTKHVVINVWNYFEREVKKSGRQTNLTEKVAKATGKILVLGLCIRCHAFILCCRHLTTISYEHSHQISEGR